MGRLIMLVAVCMTLCADAASNIPIISDLPLKDAVVGIDPVCSNSTSTPTTITVAADHDVRVYTYCKDGHKEDIKQEDDRVHYIAKVYYSGNTSEKCVFKTNPNSDFYQIALEVFYLQDGILSYKDAFVVTCTYSAFANASTQSHDLGEAMVAPYETYKHIHRSHDVHGSNSSSTFSIDVLDMREKLVTGTIPLGEKIKLRVTMTAGTTEERGFHVFSCEAVGSPGIPKFGFIREGCGEGVIISRTKGFETTGFIAESPYFQAFNLFGSKYLKFVCHFYVCHSVCDGVSCMHGLTKKRKKRNAKPSQQKNSPGVHHTVERIKDINIWKRNGAISRGILNDMNKISIYHKKNENDNVRVQEVLLSIKQDPTKGDKVYKTNNKKEDIFTPQNEDQTKGHISIEHVQYANQDKWHDMGSQVRIAQTSGDKDMASQVRIAPTSGDKNMASQVRIALTSGDKDMSSQVRIALTSGDKDMASQVRIAPTSGDKDMASQVRIAPTSGDKDMASQVRIAPTSGDKDMASQVRIAPTSGDKNMASQVRIAPTSGDKAFQMDSKIETKTENIPTTLNPRNTILSNKEWTEQQIPVNHDQYANSDHPEEMAPHVRIITGVLMFMAIISLIVLFIVLKRYNCSNTENTRREIVVFDAVS